MATKNLEKGPQWLAAGGGTETAEAMKPQLHCTADVSMCQAAAGSVDDLLLFTAKSDDDPTLDFQTLKRLAPDGSPVMYPFELLQSRDYKEHDTIFLDVADVMVQRQLENRPILLSNCRNRSLVLGLRLARLGMCCLPGLACSGHLAATFGYDLLVTPFQPSLRRDVADAAVQA